MIRLSVLVLGLAVALAVLRVSVPIPSSWASADTGCRADLSLPGDYDPADRQAYWANHQLTVPFLAFSPPPDTQVLGVTSEEKWISIDLSDQQLTAYEGSTVYLQSPISSGLKWTPTPAGEYRIWYKTASTKMSGGSKTNGTYYYLPNVPFAMFFKGSYGIHGTYWHNDFGRPRSHGCVNTPTPIAQRLFYWVGPSLPDGKRSVMASPENPGTRVVVHT